MKDSERPNSTGYSFARVRPIAPAQSRFTGGFFGDLVITCRDSMVPVMGTLMADTERPRYVGNFEVAIGAVEGRHRGPRWNDGDFYKWLEAAAAMYGITRDPRLAAQLDKLIALIGQTQEPDGYIHTDVQIAQRAGDAKPRFGNPMDFEMYNHGHLITAGCVHFAATGKRTLLDIAIKAADFLDREFADPQPAQARHGICPAHLMALTDLYRVTGTTKYLDLAMRLLNMRDLVTQGDDDNQDRIPFREQTTAHGHAVRATYLYAGAADVYAETGDESVFAPLQPIWQDLVEKKLYITGGCGALFDGASPDGAIDQTRITRVHQAFGRAYQLPHSTAHNETCAAIGNMFFAWRMFLITGECKYVDLVEHTFYNSVLAGVSLDGTSFFYTNTLRQLNDMPCELRWPRHREAFMTCFCCPPNVVRTVARLNEYAYAQSDDAIYVTLFGCSTFETTLNGEIVRISQSTRYPWEGKIQILIDQNRAEWDLRLRIPAWARGATLKVNNQPLPDPSVGEFASIRRNWRAGDCVELDLPMPTRLLEAHDLVEETRGQVAVMRGPIVYCLESADLPQGTAVMRVYLSRQSQFTTHCDPSILKGAAVLRGKAFARPITPATGAENALYRRVSAEPLADIDVALVPYFAWDNRGQGEMTVWLPSID